MNVTAAKPNTTLPDPDINEVSKPYWDALQAGKLTFQHCRHCSNNWLPARSECPRCLEADWAWHDAAGKAKLISWVVFHRAFHPAFADRLPYNVAIVELAEGPRMITNIVIDDAETLKIDQAVTFVPAQEQGHGIARFKPA
jgi:uncharacterized OB-fold protein